MQDSIQIENLQLLIPPEEVAFWPPAPSWYGIAALLLLLVIFLFVRYLKYRSFNRYRRVALSQISEAVSLLNEPKSHQKGIFINH